MEGSPVHFTAALQHEIGRDLEETTILYHDGSMSQVYFIDGQQLDAHILDILIGLTNTWKPKNTREILEQTVSIFRWMDLTNRSRSIRTRK